MNRIMLDLETLSSDSNAVIVSIGAVRFDPATNPDSWDTFYTVVDPEQRRWGRVISGDTVLWWMQQSDEARGAVAKAKPVSLGMALYKFSTWALHAGGVDEMWGNGADFDCVILGNAYQATGGERPWSYGRNRCYRTLKNLGIRLGAGDGFERAGVHHNALDDARHQALYASAYLRKLEPVR